MSRILMAASEVAPFAKTGGLADVLEALPPALAALGEEVAVVLPRYGHIHLDGARRVWDRLPVWVGRRAFAADIYRADLHGVPLFLIDCPALYDRGGIYAASSGEFPDNHLRFAAFTRAALSVARYLFRPQILHLHDWQAALTAPYLRTLFDRDPALLGIRTLLTIHNLGYQGRFTGAAFADLGLDRSMFTPGGLEFWGDVNLLKGGIRFADFLSTVSPTYALEIQTPEEGHHLDGVLRDRRADLVGILNGVDYRQWSPESDTHIAARYSANDLAGKRKCKQELLAEMGLPEENLDRPLVGIVSRFAPQKGFDLLLDLTSELLAGDFCLVVLGTGESRYEDLFNSLAAARPDRIAARIGFDNALAHKIEAGADLFLMPSRYEPCGLNQIYSLRYGTVPVVRATGGLDDTVDEATGFKFVDFTPEAMWIVLRKALECFANREQWTAMMRRGMAKDYSWGASAREYATLYRRILARARLPLQGLEGVIHS